MPYRTVALKRSVLSMAYWSFSSQSASTYTHTKERGTRFTISHIRPRLSGHKWMQLVPKQMRHSVHSFAHVTLWMDKEEKLSSGGYVVLALCRHDMCGRR